jgi:hypothetical protein
LRDERIEMRIGGRREERKIFERGGMRTIKRGLRGKGRRLREREREDQKMRERG